MKLTIKQYKRNAARLRNFTGSEQVAPSGVSAEDIQGYMKRARYLRSKVLALLLRRGANSLAHVIRGTLASAVNLGREGAKAAMREHKRRTMIRELMALDNRTLRDIGVRRDDIYSVVDDLLNAPSASAVDPAHRQKGTENIRSRSVIGRNRNAHTVLSYEDIQSYIRTGEVLGLLLIRGFSHLARVTGGVLASVINAGRWIANAIVRGHKRRAAIRKLMALDDLILKDIGLRRVDIPTVVEELLNASAPSAADTSHATHELMVTRATSKAAANDDKLKSAA